MTKPVLLYFFVGNSTFVQRDMDLLADRYDVQAYNFPFAEKWKTPFQFFPQFFFLLLNIFRCRLVICQLAGYHAFLPLLFAKIFSRPGLIIAAGTDCHSFPEIGYGNFQKKFLSYITKWCFRNCSHISPKHQSLWLCDYTYDEVKFKKQGIQAFIPAIHKPVTIIPNGFDTEKFRRTSEKKADTVITVSGNLDQPYQKALKGIDLFLGLAEKFPHVNFCIAGVGENHQLGSVPANVELIPRCSSSDLIKLFSASAFYFQLSMAEGFPNALCEAMLCECIPVGSNVFSIPEIIGDTGYLLTKRDPVLLEEMFKKALAHQPEEMGRKARGRIIQHFSLSVRKKGINQLVANMLHKN